MKAGSITVIDVRGLSGDERQGIDYIGREFAGWEASPLGNPFKAVAPYRRWLWTKIQDDTEANAYICALADRVQSGEHIKLGCWCKSKGPDTPCHGDVVKAAIEWILSERGKRNEQIATSNRRDNQEPHSGVALQN